MLTFHKKVTGTALLAGIMALTGACGNGAEPGATKKSDAPAAKDKAVEISFIHWRGEDVKSLNSIIEKFEKENPNIKVKMDIFPSDVYQSSAQAKLLDGTTGDVFTSFPGAQFESISKAGLFADLTNEKFVSNFNKNLIKSGAKDGKQLALPLQLVYNMPLYNVDMLKKFNLEPPKDWDGFLAMCEKLKQAGIIPIALPASDIGIDQLLNSMMMNNAPDEQIFQKLEAGQAKLTDDWWIKTLSQFKELNDKGYIQKDSLGTKQDVAIAMFAQEKAAMLATGSFHIATVKAQNPNIKLQVLAPITVPADKMVYEGIHTTTFMLAVNSRSKHQAEAKKFVEFLSRKDIAGQYGNETGQHVTVEGVDYTSQELKDVAVWATKKTRFQPRYLISNADIQKSLKNSIQATLGGKKPEDAAKEAQAVVDQQIKLMKSN
ncbi:ABC transporter substrate-binding protein [Paenibacillus thalictri]|uniref:Extracellular solute-binding protein n=1 Tax=Paenibacillus thalictri TaxID=2527873 RepID=A0A4V2J3L3_9BACL|nr:extracellular solute-binding protein [Paenibacillus thalictri]TBL73267.1 extracellular solute-binding protein [Paenibacillus thalictri]